MRIDRHRRQALDGSDVAQVAAEARRVDGKIVVERQHHRGDHPPGNEVLEARLFELSHRDLPSGFVEPARSRCDYHGEEMRTSRHGDGPKKTKARHSGRALVKYALVMKCRYP